MDSTGRRPRFRDIITDRTLALMLALGFSSGLPFLLVFSTQSLRLTEAGVPIEEIGMISWVALCYSLKFLWSPAIDALDVPVLARWLGRRRAWMLAAQICVAAGLILVGLTDPAHSLAGTVACLTFTAFFAATQDIVVDGWRIDSAPQERQGVMAAAYQLGFRLALICAGAGALYLAQYLGWTRAYLVMAALTPVGMLACLLSPRPPDRDPAAIQAPSFQKAFVEPLADLAHRFGPWLGVILLLVALYRLPDFLTGVMANPLYRSHGFEKPEIANISKLYGVWIGIGGAFVGGIAVARLKLMPTLLIGGIAASASHLCLAWLAASQGHRLDLLTLSVSVESFAGSFAGTALIAYMSSLVSPAMAASQYALLSSLYALPGKIIGGLSGFLVAKFGYPAFFTGSSTIGIPVALLCLLVWWRGRSAKRDATVTDDPAAVPAP